MHDVRDEKKKNTAKHIESPESEHFGPTYAVYIDGSCNFYLIYLFIFHSG